MTMKKKYYLECLVGKLRFIELETEWHDTATYQELSNWADAYVTAETGEDIVEFRITGEEDL